MTRAAAFFAAAAVLIGLGAGWFFVMRGQSNDPFAPCRRGAIASGSGGIGGPFELIGAAGNAVRDTDVITKPTLIYFGYTFCPDFCPNDLARNAEATALAAEKGLDLGMVFISIDPDRDTPQIAAEFAASIEPRAVGLSGSTEQVAAAANAYRVYFRKSGDDPEYYLMDHSTFTYLAAPGHPFLEFYSTDAAPEEIAESAACYAAAL